MGKYTVGLPRPGPNAAEVVRRWQYVVVNFNAQMATNYRQNTLAAAQSPEVLRQMQQKLETWYQVFYGHRVPERFAEIMLPVRREYKMRVWQLRAAAPVAAPPAPVAPRPAAIPAAPAPAVRV